MPVVQLARGRLARIPRLLVRELGAFGIVGASCFLLDVGLFQLLYAHAGVGAVTAKLASTAVTMSVAYVAHRCWAFSHRARTAVGRQYLTFVAVNTLTLLISLTVVAVVRYPLGQESPLVLQVANVGSIALGTVIRFLAYRRWVFLAPDGTGPAVRAALPVDRTLAAGTPVTSATSAATPG